MSFTRAKVLLSLFTVGERIEGGRGDRERIGREREREEKERERERGGRERRVY